MAFDSEGIYHRLHNWTEDRLSGINKKIQAARMDEEDNGFAAALSQTFLRDGREEMENPLNLAEHKIFNLARGALDSDAVNRKQLNEAVKKADDALKKIAESFVIVETLPAKPVDSVFYFTAEKRLYKGSRRIIEVYYSNTALTPIEVLHIYKGSQIVYKAEAYEPGTVLIKQAGAYTYKAKLPKGVFKICIASAGGTGTVWVANAMGYANSGGSGAAVEITIFNPKAQELEIYAPPGLSGYGSQTGGDAYLKIAGVEIARAKGGIGSGSGGTYSVNSSAEEVEILKIDGKNGNGSRTGFSGSVRVASVSPYDDWGWANESSSGAGGMRVEYMKYKKE